MVSPIGLIPIIARKWRNWRFWAWTLVLLLMSAAVQHILTEEIIAYPYNVYLAFAFAFAWYVIFASVWLELPWSWIAAMLILGGFGILTLEWKPVPPKSKAETTQTLDESQASEDGTNNRPHEKSPLFIDPAAIKDGRGNRPIQKSPLFIEPSTSKQNRDKWPFEKYPMFK